MNNKSAIFRGNLLFTWYQPGNLIGATCLPPPESSSFAMSCSSEIIPLSTILHLLTIKLSSNNYHLWKNQIQPLLSYQNLLGHIDGSSFAPSTTITVEGKSSPNPTYLAWHEADQWALLILQSSLSEEAMAESLGLATAREIWKALEQAYNHDSRERLQTLRDSLRQLKKVSSSVNEFGKNFKALCDQLATIEHPMDDSDKVHYFLCGLGSTFESFSTSHRIALSIPPSVICSLKQRAMRCLCLLFTVLQPQQLLPSLPKLMQIHLLQ